MVYILHDGPTGVVLLDTIPVIGYSNTNAIRILTSPQLTKVGYRYNLPNEGFTNIITKSIDYTNNIAIDIKFKDLKRYAQTGGIKTSLD